MCVCMWVIWMSVHAKVCACAHMYMGCVCVHVHVEGYVHVCMCMCAWHAHVIQTTISDAPVRVTLGTYAELPMTRPE